MKKDTLIPKQTAALTAGVSILAAVALALGFGCHAATAEAAAPKTAITFTDAGVTASGESGGYEIEGTDLTITASGVYELTGTCADGSVTVKKGTEDVTLILNGLTLTAKDSAAVICSKDSDVTIEATGVNTLSDGEDPANEESEDFDGAAIKVKSGAALTIKGSGTLNINGDCKNGIKGAASSSITIDGGVLNIRAANNGLASDHSVVINSGVVEIVAGNDGVKAEPDEGDTESAGTVAILGGDVTVDATGDGIQATGDLTIAGGRISVKSGDDAIKSDANTSVTAGTLVVEAEDDGIHAEYVLNIGVKGSSSGPDITVSRCEEGLEGAAVNLYSGKAVVTSSDDGINAANKDLSNYEYAINVYGGTWYVNASGDAMDSNQDINLYGGVTELFGSPNSGNNALDYDGLCTVEDGTLFTVDCTGMNQTPSYGTYVVFGKTEGMGLGRFPQNGQTGQLPEPGQQTEREPFQGRRGMAQEGQNGQGPVNASVEGGNPVMPENMLPPDWTEGDGATGQRPAFPEMGGRMDGAVDTSTVSIQKDSRIEVKDSSGNTLYSSVGAKAANCVMLASSDLKAGETYTLYVDGKSVVSAEAVEGTGQGGMGFGPGGQMGEWTGRPEQNTVPTGESGTKESTQADEAANQAATGYRDVSANAWYQSAVKYVSEQGMMNGTGGQRFSPDGDTTRGMVVTILYRLEGSPSVTKSSFRDVQEGGYYAHAVAWAEQNQIVNGTGNGLFNPDGKITREQLASILYRYAQYKGRNVDRTVGLDTFQDGTQVQEYARSAMEWACASGLIQGNDRKALQPQSSASRAQVATILQRFCSAEQT